MKEINKRIRYYLFLVWALLILVSVIVTLVSTRSEINRDYDLQLASSEKTQACFDAIKAYKIEHNLEVTSEDKYNCYLLGADYTEITTTQGDIRAKRTACNPNFAALYIKIFQEARLNPGDEVAVVMSGSFPTLNIACIVASEIYQLKVCLMGSIGSSTYGANNPEFTFFDMVEYLNGLGLINHHLDYVSFGGDNDTGYEYPKEIYDQIKTRIDESKSILINEPDFKTNVNLRTNYIYEALPNIKLLISIGGTLVAMGQGLDASVDYYGLVEPHYLLINKKDANNIGLLDTFLNQNVTIFQMLNIRDVAYKYGIAYDPDEIPVIGQGDIYKEKNYNLVLPIVSLTVSIGILCYLMITRLDKKRGI